MGDFALKQRSIVLVTERVWPMKMEIYLLFTPLQKKGLSIFVLRVIKEIQKFAHCI